MEVLSPQMAKALELYEEQISDFLEKGVTPDGKDHLDLLVDGQIYTLHAPAREHELVPA